MAYELANRIEEETAIDMMKAGDSERISHSEHGF
jgi:hypothetical protein